MRILRRLRHVGVRWLAGALRDRLLPAKPTFLPAVRNALTAGQALEIGGPSRLFRKRGGLPAYEWLDRIENVNFAASTAWEGQLRDGGEFRFNPTKQPGRQYLREATDLDGITTATYDAVISSHCLEHLANPLAALREWRRVTRIGGHLLIALPDPALTFDHRRPITTHAHLVSDFQAHIDEDDLSHLDEVLALHDLSLDPAAGSLAAFEARCRDNRTHRCLHHHVFNLDLLRAALTDAGWEVLSLEKLPPIHLIGLARNPGAS